MVEIMPMKILAILVYLSASATTVTPPADGTLPAVRTPPAVVEEKHCGWLVNPAFRNWWLSDQDGKWVISEPDVYEAEGIEAMPDLSVGEYNSTSSYGSYGYACACVYGKADEDSHQFISVRGVKVNTLAECESDMNLPLPPDNSDQ
jgi:hypothetical protein